MPSRTIFSDGSPSIRRPEKATVPRVGGTRPEIDLSVVDFPAPFAPSNVTIEPSGTSRDTPLSAWMPP